MVPTTMITRTLLAGHLRTAPYWCERRLFGSHSVPISHVSDPHSLRMGPHSVLAARKQLVRPTFAANSLRSSLAAALWCRSPRAFGRLCVADSKQTPAMVAGITDHCSTIRELLSFHVPPPRWTPSTPRGRPSRGL